MFRVCDQNLRVVSEWATLGAAKVSAELRAREYPGQVYFVADHMGSIWASFTV